MTPSTRSSPRIAGAELAQIAVAPRHDPVWARAALRWLNLSSFQWVDLVRPQVLAAE